MIQKRIAQWAVMAVAVPLAAAGARRLSHTLEARRGPSGASRLLTKGARPDPPAEGQAPPFLVTRDHFPAPPRTRRAGRRRRLTQSIME